MEGQGENDELYPIAVLIDELKVPNTSHRTLYASSLLHQPDLSFLVA